MIPDSVFTLTITASRLTARPMPRRTLLSFGSGKDVGIAVISAIFSAASNLGKGEFIGNVVAAASVIPRRLCCAFGNRGPRVLPGDLQKPRDRRVRRATRVDKRE